MIIESNFDTCRQNITDMCRFTKLRTRCLMIYREVINFEENIGACRSCRCMSVDSMYFLHWVHPVLVDTAFKRFDMDDMLLLLCLSFLFTEFFPQLLPTSPFSSLPSSQRYINCIGFSKILVDSMKWQHMGWSSIKLYIFNTLVSYFFYFLSISNVFFLNIY